MTVIIRLQNLPWTANALDIRRYFQGLTIPDGGVHIVGGDKGDAFIAFSTDEDARKAMMRDHGMLGTSSVKLFLSSKTEMQNVIAVARGTQPTGQAMRGDTFGRPDQQQSDVGQQQGMPSRGGMPTPGGGFRDMGMGPASLLPPTQSDRFVSGPEDIRDLRQGNRQIFQSSGSHDRSGIRGIMDTPASGMSNRMGGLSDRSQGLDQRMNRSDMHMKEGGIGDPDQRVRSLMSVGRQDIGNDDRIGGRGPLGGPDHGMGGPVGPPLIGLDQRINNRYTSSLGDISRGMESGGAVNRQMGQSQGFVSREMAMRGDMMESVRSREMGALSMRDDPIGGLDSRDNYRGDGSGLNFNSRDMPENLMNRDLTMHVGMNRRDFSVGFNQEMGFNRDNTSGAVSMNMGDAPGRSITFNQDMPNMRGEDRHFRYNQMDNVGSMPRSRSPFRDDMGRMGSDMGRDTRAFRPRSMYLEERDQEKHSSMRSFRDSERNRDRDMRGAGREMGFRQYGAGNVFLYATNMPLTVTYRDVRNFFRGCEIPRDGLKLINDRHGQRTGSVFVKFAREQGAADALKRNGNVMGDRTVRVERASEEEYLKATDSFLPPGANIYNRRESSPVRGRSRSPLQRRYSVDPNDTKYAVIKNAPYNIEKHSVKKFLGNIRSAPDGIIIGQNPDGRPSGNLYVEFESRKECQAALKLSREKMMGRTISVFPISQEEFEEKAKGGERGKGSSRIGRNKEHDAPMKLESTSIGSGEAVDGGDKQSSKRNNVGHRAIDADKKYYCVKVTGLPYSTTNATVREFFKGLEISNRGVHIAYDRKGQALSCGFVEFVTSTDCKKALDMNKQYIGKRYIEVGPITKKDMLLEFSELQNRYGSSNSRGEAGMRGTMRGGNSGRFPECLVRLTNLSMEAEIGDVLNFFRAFHPVPDSVRFHFNNMGQRTGEGLLGFETLQDAQRAIRELNLKKLMGRPLCLHLD